MLGKQKNARLIFFSSRAVTEPRRQRHTRSIFRGDAAHIQHDCAESAALQQQICHAQRLLHTRPGLCGDNRFSMRSKLSGRLGSKTSRWGVTLRCGSAHRGAVTSGLKKPLTASESPLTSLRGCEPKPPPCRPFLIGGGTRYFGGSAKLLVEIDCVFVDGRTPQRTQSSRDRSTPVAAADSGCRAFETSIQAQTFPACVI